MPSLQHSSSQEFSREPEYELIEYDSVTVPPHPLSIKPAGNAYATSVNVKAFAGFFASLPDELIIQILESLDATALQQSQCACKALYALTRLEELWKTLFVGSFTSLPIWRGTWRSTYLGIPKSHIAQINCQNLFSDILHRPFFCANTPLLPYGRNIPTGNSIPRLSSISASEFTERWMDRPFILTEPVQEWPVYRDWSIETLLEKFGNIIFSAEAVDWPFRTYVDYMNDNGDESPLYLFDRAFAEKIDLSIGKDGQYWAPDCFGDDLFSVLGDQRPDSQWLIVGPERSGSTFHKDPNATSAWNAVLEGSKYWIMFPTSPHQPPPPGVFVSEDQSEVTSPLSIAEWLIGFHAEARKTPGCKEGICHEGEVLHVPSGWWHLVVNLEPCIAITQNFVPKAHLADVLKFLKNKPAQVSGFKSNVQDPYKLFIQKMEASYPELLTEAFSHMEQTQQRKKRKWDELVHGKDGVNSSASQFSFGFGDGDEEDIP